MGIYSWLMTLLLRVSPWLEAGLSTVGLVVCVLGYRRSGKRGYLLLAVWFALVVFNYTAMPSIRAATRPPRRIPAVSREAEEAYLRECEALYSKHFGQQRPVVTDNYNVNVPLGTVVLVGSLWLLVRADTRRQLQPNKTMEATVDPPRA